MGAMATVFDDWGGVVEIAEVVGEKKESPSFVVAGGGLEWVKTRRL